MSRRQSRIRLIYSYVHAQFRSKRSGSGVPAELDIVIVALRATLWGSFKTISISRIVHVDAASCCGLATPLYCEIPRKQHIAALDSSRLAFTHELFVHLSCCVRTPRSPSEMSLPLVFSLSNCLRVILVRSHYFHSASPVYLLIWPSLNSVPTVFRRGAP